ncbi:FtsK/SpoIIIE domain-containing protein [Halorarius litoreus]|uniref:FtsK/SpoIIIE domain-containing protein n=1 Tax=Halorarius litoreus TaxID=2962676 RepID=UPI0020CD553A|nr:FtsK/SpoIIIE domain-containing protein [Halorarius litoreus]
MSAPFELRLADYLLEYFENHPPQGGQISLARFYNAKLTQDFIEAFIETDAVETGSLSVDGDAVELPTYTKTGVDTFVVRVVSNERENLEPYEVYQGFATEMRNQIADSVYGDNPKAMLMVLEADAAIDTLEASEDLFGEEGPLNLDSFQASILSPEGIDSPLGRAVLRSLQNVMEDEDFVADDVEVLETVSELRTEIEAEEWERVSELIGELPNFLPEDLLLQDAIQNSSDEDELAKELEDTLKDNQEHAERLRKAHRAGADIESTLSSTYKESFVKDVKNIGSWKSISHSKARRSIQQNPSRQFRDLSVEAEDYRVYSPPETNRIERSVIALPKDGEIQLTAEFTADMADVPKELIGPNGDEIGRTYKYEDTITAALKDLPEEEPRFAQFNLYVGKKTTQGKPTHVFRVGVVPSWFFQATEDVALDINVEEEAFVSHGDDIVTLRVPEQLGFTIEEEPDREVIDTEDPKTVTFERPLELVPDAPDIVETVACLVSPASGVPIEIQFETEVAVAETQTVQFPLFLSAIAFPDQWAKEDLRLSDSLTVDYRKGVIHASNTEGIRLEDDTLEVIQVENQLASEESIRPRQVRGDELDIGQEIDPEAELPAELEEAYGRLFEHFRDRNRTPSTDPWDERTKSVAKEVVEIYLAEVDTIGDQPAFTPYSTLRDICTIQSATTQKVWLTPYHPLILAYALRIADWRDMELVPNETAGGFRSDRFFDRFNANGLLPYRIAEGGENLLQGMALDDNHFWLVYSPVESPGSQTPNFMSRVIRDKLEAFVKAFPTLFELHPGRNLVVNLVNMGDLGPVLEGLFEFYKRTEKLGIEPPMILLRIYGGSTEGEELEKFFAEDADSSLRTRLEKKDDSIVDLLRTNLMYVREGEYDHSAEQGAHVTFFRGMLTEDYGTMDASNLPSGFLFDGLTPHASIDVSKSGRGTVYTVGFSCDESDPGLLADTARCLNALEAGKFTNGFQPGRALKKNIDSTGKGDVRALWDQALWAVHVQPNVGIEFYTRGRRQQSDSEANDTIMIHYSDQYESSSPNFDVITSTNKRKPYLRALERTLRDASLDAVLDPDTILSHLVAIDGELALDLQRGDDTKITELIGLIGGLSLSQRLLERSLGDHIWIPVSLNELTRHDRAFREVGDALLPYEDWGRASDDLCFVGVDPKADELSLQLWVVETKGGSAQLKKGREQVEGALDNLQALFHPDIKYADQRLFYGEFGKVVLDVARRLNHYGVFSDEELESLLARERSFLEGDFQIEFLTDQDGHVGEVIRVKENIFQSNYDGSNSVRTLEVPMNVLQLLKGEDVTQVLTDLNLQAIEFDSGPSKSVQPRNELRADTVESNQPEASAGQNSEEPERDGETAEGTSQPEEETARGTLSPVQEPESREPERTEDSGDASSTNQHEEHSPEEPPKSKIDTRDSGTEPQSGVSGEDEEREDAETETPPEPKAQSPISNDQSNNQEASWLEGTLPDVLEELDTGDSAEPEIDRGRLVSDLKREFESLGVRIHPPNPNDVSIGPRKIGVDVLPKEGQKVEGILNSLDSLSVHIQAQGAITGHLNPAKGAVRLEIPHDDPQSVLLSEGLDVLRDELTEPATIPLGVNTDNEHYSLSLPQERHVLIGGATGSGKSNFLATIITSLALTNDPNGLHLNILDPKGVDFGRFENLPHVKQGTYLDTPDTCTEYLWKVVTEIIPERKDHLREAGAASIQELNEYADDLDADPLPYEVIIIDEYADLVMSLEERQDEFEDAVARIAQIGRAMGIIVLLATQRPSADIVSGNIKTNFPCRISFRLPSNTDSRVILDQPGAEDLQGAGDMIALTQSGDEHHLLGYYLPPQHTMSIIRMLAQD